MVSGYERKFTAAGAEIAEETQRVNQNLSCGQILCGAGSSRRLFPERENESWN